MPRFTDDAIVLREHDWSETSQLVTLLTREHGKVRGLAKGSRRTSPGSVARFSGGFDLLTRGQVIARTRPTTELAQVTEWDLQYPHHRLHHDLDALHAAYYAADLANALYIDEDPHPNAFAALQSFLEAVAENIEEKVNVPGALLRLQWELLDDAGYRPELERDVRTEGPLPNAGSYHFDPVAGGLTSHAAPGTYGVRRGTVHLLRELANHIETVPPASMESLHRANRLLATYARALLDRELPTMSLLPIPRREQQGMR